MKFFKSTLEVSKHLFDLLSSPSVLVNFHSKIKILGRVAEFFSEAFLCRLLSGNLPHPIVYSVLDLPV